MSYELDELEVAYEELRLKYVRLEWEHTKLKRQLAHAHDALDNYEFIATYVTDPFAF